MMRQRHSLDAVHLVSLAGLLGLMSGMPVICRAAPPTGNRPQTEIVGLRLEGTRAWQRVTVDDLDVLTTADGKRLLPLHRLLSLLGRSPKTQNGKLSFNFEGGPQVTLDPGTGAATLPDGPAVISVIKQRSEITDKQEIYVPAPVLIQWMALPLRWDEQEYAYHASVKRKVGFWRSPEAPSLLDFEAQLIPANLPRMHPAARPDRFSLDYIDLQMRLDADLITPEDRKRQARLGSLEQTFWGRAFGGGYKLRLRQPATLWVESAGPKIVPDNVDPIQIQSFDWVRQWDTGQVVVGDINTGFNDLVFPFVSYTGVTVSGVFGSGWNTDALADQPWRGGISVPRRFTGVAEVGSVVELFINGRLIETDEVIAVDTNAPPNFGTWEFEDIRLPPGALNEVRIRVTDPNGVVTQIDRSVLGTSVLLPAGAGIYLAGIGAQRQIDQALLGGLVVGGRALYGVSDRLTVGVVGAYQNDFHHFLTPQSTLPVTSSHMGWEAFVQPRDDLLLVADVAVHSSQYRDGTVQNDIACFARAHWYAQPTLTLSASTFYYGPEYFNGESMQPSDRMGAWVAGDWDVHPQVGTRASAGWVTDAGGQTVEESQHVTFQHVGVMTRPLGWLGVNYSLDRLVPQNERQIILHTFEVDAQPLPNLTITGHHSYGDDLTADGGGDALLNGLNLPSINLGQIEQTRLTGRYRLGPGHSVALQYTESQADERAVLLHDVRTFSPPYLIVHTEFGKQLQLNQWVFENRTDWLLDRQGEYRIGLRITHAQEETTVGVFFTITDQLVLHDQGFSRTADLAGDPAFYQGIRSPDSAGGVKGRVFVDANANGLLDPGEVGVGDVQVNVGNLDTVNTDARGVYVLPGITGADQVRVWLDIDSLPAIYTPTHGIQTAMLSSRSLTRVNLGVAPSHGISGHIRVANAKRLGLNAAGVRVLLIRVKDKQEVAHSITAGDGSYYLGELRPGSYRIQIDTPTLPPGMRVQQGPDTIEIKPTADPQYLEMEPIVLAATGQPAEPDDSTTTPPDKPVPTIILPEP